MVNAYQVYDSVRHQIMRLQEEFKKKDVAIDIWNNEKPPVYIDGQDLICYLKDYDFVINLDKDQYIVKMLEKAGMMVFNSAESLVLCDDKMLTYIALANANIKMPKTLAAPLCYHDRPNDHWLKLVMSTFSFPMVVKECFGSLGEQVHLVSNEQELRKIDEQLRMKPHIYQEFISSSYGRDVRVIVINQQAVAWMERKSNGDFRSNLSKGGTAKKIALPLAFKETAEKAARILHLDYCGVDLLYGPDQEPILCEVNSNAFFKGIEAVTRVNVAQIFVNYILSKLNN